MAPILIAGPTASGKSRLALHLARERGGMVVNADSMQVYGELRILSARPTPAEEAEVPHRLYGHVPAATRYSVGRWRNDMAAALAEARRLDLVPIIVGGTGLYFRALTEGLAAVPDIPAEVRERLAAEAEGLATADLHRRLADLSPEDARLIRPSDRSRVLRALEVFEATGRSLARWRAGEPLPPLVGDEVERLVVEPDRARLHSQIAERAEAMVRGGAFAEAEAIGRLGLAPDLPAMKAIGVRELLDHMTGKLSLDEALAAMKTETRRYAKRQMTWFRHQMPDWRRLAVGDAADVIDAL